MESENESVIKDSKVKDLQANLFPPTPKTAYGYFANFFIKANSCFDKVDYDERFKVKETPSKELFLLNRDIPFTPQQSRWPTECQVLEERVSHIEYNPSTPEPYYVVTGKEVQPKPTGDECGVIVYQYIPISAVNYFSRSSVGGSKYLLPTNLCQEEDSLKFESRFESGNLERAIRITPNYYELHLRADLYTNRHMQWFYFRITNTKKNFMYRFSIVNFSKEDSLYNEGMRPLIYSTKDSQLHSIGWRRCGDNITYYSNDNVSPEDTDQQITYTLSFTTEFPHDDDVIYLAHCYPYTYSNLEDYLSELSNHPIKSNFTTVRLLCKSLAGNNVHYVTITSPPVSGDIKKKRAIVITARVHPGETPSSWMMKGILDFLTNDSGPAKELRDKFIFKLVPMLNPDGVIVGNNRCSLSAKDLNRQYRTVMRDAYPSIWYTKLMVRRLLEECGVGMYCDLHAHSRKHNIFIYGCESRRNAERPLQEQVFPLMLHKNTADKFSFESCKFRVQKSKEGTGRVVMWMMGIANSYTIEASFAGSTIGTRCDTHFSVQDFEQMGRSFCQTLLDFYDDDPRKEKLRIKIINRLMKGGSNADEPANIKLSDYSTDDGDTSSSSSNEVGQDYDYDIILPTVPPPSPVIHKKSKSKLTRTKTKIFTKSPIVNRKPLPIFKTTLGLSLSEKEIRCSSDSTDSELEIMHHEKIKTLRKKRKKKKTTKKKSQISYYSDCEIQYKETIIRSVSVFDMVPSDKLQAQKIKSKTSKPQPKPLMDRRNIVTQRLAQVQAKLLALKNKLWFGCGDGDINVPLSWGTGNFCFPNISPTPIKTKDSNKSSSKQQSNKLQKKLSKSKDNNKIRVEKLVKKSHTNGLRRQTAIDWSTSSNTSKIRKSKSLPDSTTIRNVNNKNDYDYDDDKQEFKKKKKKKPKFVKKIKTVTNVKVFLKKD